MICLLAYRCESSTHLYTSFQLFGNLVIQLPRVFPLTLWTSSSRRGISRSIVVGLVEVPKIYWITMLTSCFIRGNSYNFFFVHAVEPNDFHPQACVLQSQSIVLKISIISIQGKMESGVFLHPQPLQNLLNSD